MAKRSHQRSGILLLIVLSILVLFALIGTTWLVVAQNMNRVAKINAKLDSKGVRPEQLLDSALYDLVRGVLDPRSPLHNHSLLQDVYGNDGFMGVVGAVQTSPYYNDLLEIPFAYLPTRGPFVGAHLDQLFDNNVQAGLSSLDKFHYYSGCVLTFLDGILAGKSYRILDHTLPTTNERQSLIIQLDQPLSIAQKNSLRLNRFLVNGRPFNGTGAGYDPESGELDNGADEFEFEMALLGGNIEAPLSLLPMYHFVGEQVNPPFPRFQRTFDLNVGGLDESWDVADYQNLFLGVQPLPPEPIAAGLATNPDLESIGIPSFHRPFLLNYWLHRLYEEGVSDYWGLTRHWSAHMAFPSGQSMFAGRFRRSIISRPLPIDHPNFDGSNPTFKHPGFVTDANGQLVTPVRLITNFWNIDGDNLPDCMDPDFLDASLVPVTSGGNGYEPNGDGTLDVDANGMSVMPLCRGPWDVDNDNDTIPDSVWVDLGYPVQSTKDGRQYKPLFAILCVDLDGRMNVNAHGIPAHSLSKQTNLASFDSQEIAGTNVIAPNQPVTNPGTLLAQAAHTGQGYGPPEINILRGMTQLGINVANIGLLFQDRWMGQRDSSLSPLGSGTTWYPGNQNLDPTFEPENAIREWSEIGSVANLNWVNDSENFISSNYGSPPDYKGRRIVLLDSLGQPRMIDAFDDLGTGWQGETSNDPYEIDLISPNQNDSLFSVSELELLLRVHDHDSTRLPQRLFSHLHPSPIQVDPLQYYRLSRNFTTRSRHIPTLGSGNAYANRRAESTAYGFLQQTNPGDPYEFEPQEMPGIEIDFNENNLIDVNDQSVRFNGQGIVDLFVKRLREGYYQRNAASPPANPNDPNLQEVIRQQLFLMMAPELRHGQKLNLNRMFGNGLDDNANRVIDDPHENVAQNIRTPYSGNPSVTADFTLSRQNFVRHLYCLMMLLTEDFEYPITEIEEDTIVQAYASNPAQGFHVQHAKDRVRAYRIAQWAVNVADFRDPDAIMTPFEFDVYPFDGWDVDGNLATGERPIDINPTYNENDPDDVEQTPIFRGVVWGCEAPEVVISETLALHDRRVEDLDSDVSGEFRAEQDMVNMMWMTKDEDLDQRRIPQGSLFVELFCPRSPETQNQSAKFPAEFYEKQSNGLWTLNLAKKPFPNDVNPVWRLVVVRHKRISVGGNPKENQSVSRAARLRPNTFGINDTFVDNAGNLINYDPSNPNIAVPSISVQSDPDITARNRSDHVFEVERIVWFGSNDPANRFRMNTATPNPINERAFWNYSTQTSIPAGGYLVMGPRQNTKLSVDTTDPLLANQRIEIFPNQGVVRHHTSSNQFTQRRVFSMLVGRPAPWFGPGNAPNETHARDWIGMNISEPMPILNANGDLWADTGYYNKPETGDEVSGAYLTPIDEPFDNRPRSQLYEDGVSVNIEQRNPGTNGLGQGIGKGTIKDHKTLLLQRLANPLASWDANLNPYITVDHMPIDLTIYNGEGKDKQWALGQAEPRWAEELEPGEKYDGEEFPSGFDDNPNSLFMTFSSRERSGHDEHMRDPTQTQVPPRRPNNLWAQNSVARRHLSPAALPLIVGDEFPEAVIQGLGHPGIAFGGAEIDNSPRPGAWGKAPRPSNSIPDFAPFPWLVWNNRPYISEFELMQVPTSSASQLLGNFWMLHEKDPAFDSYTPNGTQYVEESLHFRGEFGHLLNFFHSDEDRLESPNLARIFDLVGVPSRYVGTQKYGNPQQMQLSAMNAAGLPTKFLEYAAPFHGVSVFLEPGRININTIPNIAVWSSLDTSIANIWAKVYESRQGGTTISELPSRFANPFRSTDHADLMPDLPNLIKNASSAGLLRKEPGGDLPLFANEHIAPADMPRNTQRNSFFRYHSINRLGNMLTTQSNNYAVWITVGYFEVLPWNPRNPMDPTLPPVRDVAHPDGLQLGKELGIETGNVKRHRAFYIIDRSVPVAFQKGEDHNVEKTILLKRFIE